MKHVHIASGRRYLLALIGALVLALAISPAALAAGKSRGHGKAQQHGKSHHKHSHKGKVRAHGRGHHHSGGHRGHRGLGRTVSTMTRNLYLGANLTPAIGAPSLEALTAANGQILREVTANDFPTRVQGLAAEIRSERPDLIGLQEVALWRTAPVDFGVLTTGPSATTVRYDYLQELLAELNNGKGPGYEVVVVQQEFDLEAPADEDGDPETGPLGADINGRLTMRDAILAKRSHGVHTWGSSSGNFSTLLEVPILGQPFPIARGWTATEARVRGSGPFRLVNTHLEAFHPLIRQAQAAELVTPGGPATSERPVVLVGDLNSDDDTVEGADRLAYETIQAGGFVERSTDEPLSCCLNSSLLAEGAGGSVADFDHQVDHIMVDDPSIGLKYSHVTGLEPVNGFWNSDHAGITSALKFGH